jgi:hypothetical protein
MAHDGVILPHLQFSPQLMVECPLFVLLQCTLRCHRYKCYKINNSKPSPYTLVTQQAGVLSVLAQLCFEEKSAVYPWFLVTIVCLLFATHNSLCCLHWTCRVLFSESLEDFPAYVAVGTILEHLSRALNK